MTEMKEIKTQKEEYVQPKCLLPEAEEKLAVEASRRGDIDTFKKILERNGLEFEDDLIPDGFFPVDGR